MLLTPKNKMSIKQQAQREKSHYEGKNVRWTIYMYTENPERVIFIFFHTYVEFDKAFKRTERTSLVSSNNKKKKEEE